jgi:hypothetical protein
VLRPDKLVLYADDRDAMRRLATEAAVALSGFDAHGVPFTAAADTTGLVTWGLDPLPSRRVHLPGGSSWRQLTAYHLANAFRVADVENPEELVEFALARVQLESVDTSTWQPAEDY